MFSIVPHLFIAAAEGSSGLGQSSIRSIRTSFVRFMALIRRAHIDPWPFVFHSAARSSEHHPSPRDEAARRPVAGITIRTFEGLQIPNLDVCKNTPSSRCKGVFNHPQEIACDEEEFQSLLWLQVRHVVLVMGISVPNPANPASENANQSGLIRHFSCFETD